MPDATRPAARQSGSTSEPGRDCPLCPRLVDFRENARAKEPTWFNGPVPSFGEADARLLVVGLAPGLAGANRTGRPFTGDHAGELLYATLLKFGFATGTYAARSDDGLGLFGCMITNAVRCVPPQNKPTPAETRTCNAFLANRIASLPELTVIIALGRIAHDAALSALGQRRTAFTFGHGLVHAIDTDMHRRPITLIDSYHCSRYNTNTGLLTTPMFEAVFAKARAVIDTATASS